MQMGRGDAVRDHGEHDAPAVLHLTGRSLAGEKPMNELRLRWRIDRLSQARGVPCPRGYKPGLGPGIPMAQSSHHPARARHRPNLTLCLCPSPEIRLAPMTSRGVNTWEFYNAPPFQTLPTLTLTASCKFSDGMCPCVCTCPTTR